MDDTQRPLRMTPFVSASISRFVCAVLQNVDHDGFTFLKNVHFDEITPMFLEEKHQL